MLVYVPEWYCSKRRTDLEADNTKIEWVELHLQKRVILLSNIYRPPKAGKEVLDSINRMLDLTATEKKEVILMGDMKINLLKQGQVRLMSCC